MTNWNKEVWVTQSSMVLLTASMPYDETRWASFILDNTEARHTRTHPLSTLSFGSDSLRRAKLYVFMQWFQPAETGSSCRPNEEVGTESLRPIQQFLNPH